MGGFQIAYNTHCTVKPLKLIEKLARNYNASLRGEHPYRIHSWEAELLCSLVRI